MRFTITDDQNYCSFGDGIVYEFFSSEDLECLIDCIRCIFYINRKIPSMDMKCKLVPCQSARRKDNKEGYWKQSLDVDFESYACMFN